MCMSWGEKNGDLAGCNETVRIQIPFVHDVVNYFGDETTPELGQQHGCWLGVATSSATTVLNLQNNWVRIFVKGVGQLLASSLFWERIDNVHISVIPWMNSAE